MGAKFTPTTPAQVSGRFLFQRARRSLTAKPESESGDVCSLPPPDVHREAPPLDAEVGGPLSDPQRRHVFPSYHREPSYFEIPTKDFQQQQQHAKGPGAELQEIPTKDTDTPPATPPSPPTPTPPIVQSHASFTIEFDDCTPGKIKIKDHVTKFSTRQRKQQAPPTRMAAEEISAESKVADWLVHSDVTLMRRRPTCEDVYSTKSDLAVNIKTLKGHHHEDGTQSDSEDPVLKGRRSKSQHSVQSEQSQASQQTVQSAQSACSQPPAPTQILHQPLQRSPPGTPPVPSSPAGAEPPRSPPQESPAAAAAAGGEAPRQGPPEHLTQQAFIIEFFDDNPRKKRSQSFTHNPAHADSYSAMKAKLERRKGGERPASVHGHVPPTQQVTVPLKGQGQGQGHGGPQRSSSLKREKTEGEAASPGSSSSSRSSSGIVIRPFGSVGKKSRLAQEFAAELLKDSAAHRDASPTRDKTSPPPMSAPPVMVSPARVRIPSPQEPPARSSVSYPTSPLQALGPSKPSAPAPAPPTRDQTPSPAHSSGHPKCPAPSAAAVRQRMRTEEDDSLSDAGTYTIETESQDKEVEEARNMIDQVRPPQP